MGKEDHRIETSSAGFSDVRNVGTVHQWQAGPLGSSRQDEASFLNSALDHPQAASSLPHPRSQPMADRGGQKVDDSAQLVFHATAGLSPIEIVQNIEASALPARVSCDPENRIVTIDRNTYKLTRTEFRVFNLLFQAAPQPVSKKELGQAIWGDTKTAGTNAQEYIGYIRKKIEPNPQKPIYIITLYNIGFRLTVYPSDRKEMLSIKVGPLILYPDFLVCKYDEKTIQFTPTEWKLLEAFVKQPGRIVTNEELIHAVWGEVDSKDTINLRYYIRQLRLKLESDMGKPSLIVSKSGRGYVFLPEEDHSANKLIMGDLELDMDRHQVTKNGIELSLSVLEYRFLLYLFENRGRRVTKQELAKQVFDGAGFRAIKLYIHQLRYKVEPDPLRPRYIHTVRSRGYVFEDWEFRNVGESRVDDRRFFKLVDFVFDDVAAELTRDGIRIKLSPKEQSLLSALLSYRMKPASRESLEKAIWGDIPDNPKSLDILVYTLRRKFGEDGQNPTYILTVRGFGYMLNV